MTQQYKGFFVDSGTLKVDLEEDHWVEIKTEMSIGDWERYEAGMLQIVAESEAENSVPRSIRRRQQRQNSKNNTHSIKYLGLKDPLNNRRGDLYIIFRLNLDKHNLQSEEDKNLVEVLFN